MITILEKGLIGILGYGDNQTVIFLAGALCMILSYLMGSINFAVIFSRKLYVDDIRGHGSGNAGSTNMLRTYGIKSAALTFLCDFAKSFFATAIGLVVMPFYTGFAFVTGFCCLLGHAWPIFFGFRGGKCVASLAGVVLLINPPVWVLLVVVFALTLLISRYVSLGSTIGSLLLPIFNAWMPFWASPTPPTAVIFTTLMAILVVFLHRKNIVRLWNGTESKISFGKKKS